MAGAASTLLYLKYRRGGVLYSPRVAGEYRTEQDCRLPKNCRPFLRKKWSAKKT